MQKLIHVIDGEAKIHQTCPFYGFSPALIDTRGNQCALIEGHSPCKMEMREQKPSYSNCPVAGMPEAYRIIQILIEKDPRIFPEELHPKDALSWDGISFRGWFNLITQLDMAVSQD